VPVERQAFFGGVLARLFSEIYLYLPNICRNKLHFFVKNDAAQASYVGKSTA
jgi:hypothetical protein